MKFLLMLMVVHCTSSFITSGVPVFVRVHHMPGCLHTAGLSPSEQLISFLCGRICCESLRALHSNCVEAKTDKKKHDSRHTSGFNSGLLYLAHCWVVLLLLPIFLRRNTACTFVLCGTSWVPLTEYQQQQSQRTKAIEGDRISLVS